MSKSSPITKYRENKGLTLEAFGELFKPAVDKSTVLRWEKGKLPYRRALEVEKVTGIDRRKLVPAMFKGLEAAQ